MSPHSSSKSQSASRNTPPNDEPGESVSTENNVSPQSGNSSTAKYPTSTNKRENGTTATSRDHEDDDVSFPKIRKSLLRMCVSSTLSLRNSRTRRRRICFNGYSWVCR